MQANEQIARRYDYSSSHDDAYYIQPQYPLSQNNCSPASRIDRNRINSDSWSPSRYTPPSRNRRSSPYYPPRSPEQSRERASYDNDRGRNAFLRGSRESPIYVEDVAETVQRRIFQTYGRIGTTFDQEIFEKLRPKN